MLFRSQSNRLSRLSGSMATSGWSLWSLTRFIYEAEFNVLILFETLSSLDLPVWVFTQGEVVVVGFIWCGLVRITILVSCQIFFFRGGKGA